MLITAMTCNGMSIDRLPHEPFVEFKTRAIDAAKKHRNKTDRPGILVLFCNGSVEDEDKND
ncbi:hypothetical protein KAR91_14150 [Candidatus Pacearchaeota archaeon]|nr:hypothetical protein [Candidatus Pacearchaeota archaeon]